MKCASCNGNLNGTETVCPYCGSREEVDLRAVNSRCLGDAAEACPRCESALETWQLNVATDQTHLDIERCRECSGIFFNPGELESFLHHQVVSTVWLDWDKIEALKAEAASANDDHWKEHEKHYLSCPVCKEIMNSVNFGRRSGVLIDVCRPHGIWLDGGELRRISEWWHAGGKHEHQANEIAKVERMRSEAKPVTLPSYSMDHYPNRDPLDFSVPAAILEILATVAGFLLK